MCQSIRLRHKILPNSPTLDEGSLQNAILAAIQSAMSDKETLSRDISGAMELEPLPIPGQTMSLADIDRRLEKINTEIGTALAKAGTAGDREPYVERIRVLSEEAATLKEKRETLLKQRQENGGITRLMETMVMAIREASAEIEVWDESVIRQLVDTVKVLSAEQIEVHLRSGMMITQNISNIKQPGKKDGKSVLPFSLGCFINGTRPAQNSML